MIPKTMILDNINYEFHKVCLDKGELECTLKEAIDKGYDYIWVPTTELKFRTEVDLFYVNKDKAHGNYPWNHSHGFLENLSNALDFKINRAKEIVINMEDFSTASKLLNEVKQEVLNSLTPLAKLEHTERKYRKLVDCPLWSEFKYIIYLSAFEPDEIVKNVFSWINDDYQFNCLDKWYDFNLVKDIVQRELEHIKFKGLRGSEKQIDWALNIREEKRENWIWTYINRNYSTPVISLSSTLQILDVVEVFKKRTYASWWIEHRYDPLFNSKVCPYRTRSREF